MDLAKTNWNGPKRLVLDQNYLDGPKSFWTHRRTRHQFLFQDSTAVPNSCTFFPQTIDSLPGAFFILAGGINMICVVIFGIVYIRRGDFVLMKEEKKKQLYSELEPMK